MLKWCARIAVLFIALCYNEASAQSAYTNVVIDVQENNGQYPPCEPSICVDPTNPANVVAGSILDKVYFSSDSGRTWTETRLRSPHGVYGDPCVVANSKGDFYYLHLGDPGGKGWYGDRFLECIVAHRSMDKGQTWSEGGAIGTNPPKDQDKEWAACSPNARRIHTTWTQFDKYESKVPTDSSNILYSWSRRKAKKWSKPVRINQFSGNCADDDGTVEGAVPAVGNDGEVYVAWALNQKIYFDRSFDKGKTWVERDIVAAEIVGGWNQDIPGIQRCNGMPVLMVDRSPGPYRGRLYICWSDIRNGQDNTDVFITWSDDRGDTWSDPIRVNDDKGNHHQFFPWLAIDQTDGSLHVVFYDRRINQDLATEVYWASSVDGGSTWKNERISESPFVPESSVFFGDYNNISAHDGVVRPIWTRLHNGRLSVMTALIQAPRP
jgi:hypothetical protein